MLATLGLVVGGFAWGIARSYRRSRDGSFRPQGKVRWTEDPS